MAKLNLKPASSQAVHFALKLVESRPRLGDEPFEADFGDESTPVSDSARTAPV
jgi:hypothetical protein